MMLTHRLQKVAMIGLKFGQHRKPRRIAMRVTTTRPRASPLEIIVMDRAT
jgi:hypothetical protein